MQILTEPQIYELLTGLSGRTYENGVIQTTYEFESFLEAISFVNDLVPVCEELQHHPDILIRYNQVTVSTSTHDIEDKITDKDFELANAIEGLVV